MTRARTGWTAALLAALGLWGCGSAWTYDAALVERWRAQNFSFVPPDSIAFAPPEIPLVYDVVFQASDLPVYVEAVPAAAAPPPPRRTVVTTAVRPDTVFIFVPDTSATALAQPAELVEAPPPALPVQVDLTEAQEAALLAQMERDVKRTEDLLASAQRAGTDSKSRTEQVTAARSLIAQAKSARDRNDYQGAANLARKARLLMENLAAQKR